MPSAPAVGPERGGATADATGFHEALSDTEAVGEKNTKTASIPPKPDQNSASESHAGTKSMRSPI